MNRDWKQLIPHRPLDPGDNRYIERPSDGGARIAEWVHAGRSTLLVIGPVGIGKSTEVANAALRLQSDRVAVLVQLDRVANMRVLNPDDARNVITGRVADVALRILGLDLSDPLREVLVSRGLLDPTQIRKSGGGAISASPRALLDVTLREVTRLSRQKRLCILVDGLEKSPEAVGRAVFEALAGIPEDVELVVVVPWWAAYGPPAQEVIRPGEKPIMLRPLVVDGQEGSTGRVFLRRVLEGRLSAPDGSFSDGPLTQFLAQEAGAALPPDETILVVQEAILLSGGIPRAFLQLVADMGSRASLRYSMPGAWPGLPDFTDTVAEHQDSYRRLLLRGDDEELRKVDGTDGREMDLDRKIRLLNHGILLERDEGGQAVMRVHPLVAPILGKGKVDA